MRDTLKITAFTTIVFTMAAGIAHLLRMAGAPVEMAAAGTLAWFALSILIALCIGKVIRNADEPPDEPIYDLADPNVIALVDRLRGNVGVTGRSVRHKDAPALSAKNSRLHGGDVEAARNFRHLIGDPDSVLHGESGDNR